MPQQFRVGMEIYLLGASMFIAQSRQIERAVRATGGAIEEQAQRSLARSKLQMTAANRVQDADARALAQQRAAISQATAQTKIMEARATQLNTSMMFLGGTLSMLGAALLTLTKTTVDYSSKITPLIMSTRGIAQASGITQKELAKTTESIMDQGFAVDVVYKNTSQLIAQQMGLVSSQELAAAANRMAASSTLEAADIYTRLTDAVTNANTEGMTSLGIISSMETIQKSYAATLGKTADQLTKLEKQHAVYNYIIGVSKRFGGEFDKSLQTVAMQSRLADANLKNLGYTLYRYVEPTIAGVLLRVNQLIGWFSKLSPYTQSLVAQTILWSGVLLTAAGSLIMLKVAIAPVILAVGNLLKVVATAPGLFARTFLALPIHLKLVGLAIAALAVAFATDFKGMRTTVNTAVRGMADDFDSMAVRFAVGGARLMGSFASGIAMGLASIIEMVTVVVQSIADLLIGHSPPPKGPLSKIDEGGYKTLEAWVLGAASVPTKPILDLAERVKLQLEQVLFEIKEELYKLSEQEAELDRALWPYEDRLTRIEAKAKLITIPLERQKRILQEEKDRLQDIVDAEEERRQKILAQIEAQRDGIQISLDLERERYDLISHEQFIEELRNKISHRETSLRAIALRGQAILQADVVANLEAQLKAVEDALKKEKERQANNEIAEKAQLKLIERQMELIERQIQAEEDKVQYAREELDLAKANQAEQRLTIEQNRRYWEMQQTQAQHMLDIVNRIKELEGETGKFVEDWGELTKGLNIAPIEMPKIDIDTSKLKEALDRMRAAFDESFKPGKTSLDQAVERWNAALGRFGVTTDSVLGGTKDKFKSLFAWLDDLVVPKGLVNVFGIGAQWILFGPLGDPEFWKQAELNKKQWQAFWDWIEIAADKAWDWLRGGWKDTFKSLQKEINDWIDPMGLTWQTFWNKLNLGQWILDRIADLGSFLQQVIDFFENPDKQKVVWDAAAKLGAAIAGGILKGIQDGWNAIVGWITKAVDDIIGAITSRLGKASSQAPKTETEGTSGKFFFPNNRSSSWVSSPVTTNTTFTRTGPQITVYANYAKQQSPSKIKSDIQLVAAYL